MSEGRICTTNSWHRLDTGQRAFGQSLLPMRIIAIPLSFRCCTDVSCNCSSSFFSPSFFDSRKNCPVLTAQNDLQHLFYVQMIKKLWKWYRYMSHVSISIYCNINFAVIVEWKIREMSVILIFQVWNIN